MRTFTIALKLVRRDVKAGELWLFLLSLLIAITCISSMQMFTHRVKKTIDQQVATLLGGDLVIQSNTAFKPEFTEKTKQLQLTQTITKSFFSMVRAKENLVLADIKSVNENYPLRGHLKVSQQPFAAPTMTTAIPKPGEVWVQQRLLPLLQAKIGDNVKVGRTQFVIASILEYEPDRAGSWFSIAPRVLINEKDLAQTGIIQPGSRISYKMLITGDQSQIEQLTDWLKPKLSSDQRVINANQDQPQLSKILDKSAHYLNLASVISVILAGIAIAIASQKYTFRHRNTVALMRCFGASNQSTTVIFSMALLIISTVAIVAGIGIGYFLQVLLENLFSGLVNFSLPKANLVSALPAVIIGLILVFGFSLPQLLRLKNITAKELLQENLNKHLPNINPFIYGSALTSVVLLLWWQSQDLTLLGVLILGFGGSIGLIFLLAKLAIWVINKIHIRFSLGPRLGMLNLIRHRSNTLLHITAFALIFLLILILGILRHSLLSDWNKSLPANTPNHFLINIPSEKATELQQFLTTKKVSKEALYPLIRGRLLRLNNEDIKDSVPEEQKNSPTLHRDINLTYRQQLPKNNSIIEGSWWSKDNRAALVSVEQGVAERLGLHLGDRIEFNIGGTAISAEISNIRTVEWTSFKPNFFFIFNSGVLEQFPSTYMTSFFLPPNRGEVLNELISKFPNITILDVAQITENIQKIIQHVSLAITYILFFMLSTGVLVLVASIMANLDQRAHNSAIMRANGATSTLIRTMLLSEFTLIGLLGGFCAAICSIMCTWILSIYLFDNVLAISLWPLWFAPLASAILIAVTGYLGSLKVLRSTPMQLLRTFD